MDYMDAYNAIQYQIAQNNSWSAEQAQKQMDFQERMANTAHQREVEDLKAAGLNPVLSAHSNGAATPSGAMAQADQNSTSAIAGLLKDMIEGQTAIGIANARALGTAYNGNGNGNSIDNSEDNESNHNGTSDGYDDKPMFQRGWLGAVERGFEGFTGMNFNEAAHQAGVNLDNGTAARTQRALKHGDKGQPAVTTAKGNTEYGARTFEAGVVQAIRNAVNNVFNKGDKGKHTGKF